jgi:tRNA (guanosine-2'-O-)-methyltransferase
MSELELVISGLSKFVTDERLQLFHEVLENRTRYLTVVLEDIYQAQNASAVLRTAECFGIQDVHVIENKNKYNVNPDVALGSTKWINLFRHNETTNNTVKAIKKLKNEGYRIVATTPHTHNVGLNEFDLSKGKVALFFGTELKGLSNKMLKHADEYLKIPMYGFTESFNISVSAAIILSQLTGNLRNGNLNWQLNSNEKDVVLLKWLTKTIKKSDIVLKELCKSQGINHNSIKALL